jgi:exosortase family protein XrtF
LRAFLKKNKAVIKFLIIFFGSYVLLTIFYQLYLTYLSSTDYYPDYLTNVVAHQSEELIAAFGHETYIAKTPSDESMSIAIGQQYIIRVVEGCNSMSVLIMFLSFILAFHAKWKATLLYILAGSAVIYVLNVFRIALIAIGIHEIPQHKDLLHDIFFPLFIYGVVFLLWVVWVKYYQKTIQVGKKN